MTEREATDAEMLAAVERWARATGRAVTAGARKLAGDWIISSRFVDSPGLAVYLAKDGTRWNLDPHTALVWALCVEAGLTVDAGRCQACDGAGWLPKIAADNSCPDCNGTGKDTREAARLVLDAAAKPCPEQGGRTLVQGEGDTSWRRHRKDDPPDITKIHAVAYPAGSYTVCPHCDGLGSILGDPTDRDALHVEADRLQGDGDPLGEWLALWLADGRDNTIDAVNRLHALALRHELANYPSGPDDRTDALSVRRPVCERCDDTGRVTTYRANVGWGETEMEVPGPGLSSGVTRDCPDCTLL